MAQKGIHGNVKNKHLVNCYNLYMYMLDKSVVLTNTYLHFCSHLAAKKSLDALAGDFCPHLVVRNRLDALAGDFCPHLVVRNRLDALAGDFCPHLLVRNRLDALGGNFCPHLAARNRLDALAGDTVDQSVVFSQTIGFPSLGCKTHSFSEWVRLWWWLFHGGTERNGTKV